MSVTKEEIQELIVKEANTVSLDLSNNKIINVDFLKGFTNLTKLNLDSCKYLKNVDRLKNLTNLTYLNMWGCSELQNVDGLKNLTNLTYLNMWGCRELQNVDGLENLMNLTSLDLSYCTKLRNVDGLANLTNLKKLNLNNCSELQYVDGLENLMNLTSLDLSYCTELQNIDCINFKNIRNLDTEGCYNLRSSNILRDGSKFRSLLIILFPFFLYFFLIGIESYISYESDYNELKDECVFVEAEVIIISDLFYETSYMYVQADSSSGFDFIHRIRLYNESELFNKEKYINKMVSVRISTTNNNTIMLSSQFDRGHVYNIYYLYIGSVVVVLFLPFFYCYNIIKHHFFYQGELFLIILIFFNTKYYSLVSTYKNYFKFVIQLLFYGVIYVVSCSSI